MSFSDFDYLADCLDNDDFLYYLAILGWMCCWDDHFVKPIGVGDYEPLLFCLP